MIENAKKDFLENRVIPVAVFDTVKDACQTVELLLENSFKTVEVTLRTEGAFDCIKEISGRFPEIKTGAGSILDVDSLKMAVDCGAVYAVAPVLDLDVLRYSVDNDIFFIPGVSTPTEFGTALKYGDVVKIFPASQLGGAAYIKSICAPFASKKYHLVPTGGINRDNYHEYLSIPAVSSCGMSYIVDSSLIRSGRFGELDERMKHIARGL